VANYIGGSFLSPPILKLPKGIAAVIGSETYDSYIIAQKKTPCNARGLLCLYDYFVGVKA